MKMWDKIGYFIYEGEYDSVKSGSFYFDNYYVRIDILERLFVQIINSDLEKSKEIKLVPEMLNLLGCSKDNFKRLIEKMNYKTIEKDKDIYFSYSPKKQNKKTFKKINPSNSPFKVLKNLNFN